MVTIGNPDEDNEDHVAEEEEPAPEVAKAKKVKKRVKIVEEVDGETAEQRALRLLGQSDGF